MFLCVNPQMTELLGEGNTFSQLRKPENGCSFSAVIRKGSGRGFDKVFIRDFKVTKKAGVIRETGLISVIKNFLGSRSSLSQLVSTHLPAVDDTSRSVPVRLLAYKVKGKGQCLVRCLAAQLENDQIWLTKKNRQELKGWCCLSGNKENIKMAIKDALTYQFDYLNIEENNIDEITTSIFANTIENGAFNFSKERVLSKIIHPFNNSQLTEAAYYAKCHNNLAMVANYINDRLIAKFDAKEMVTFGEKTSVSQLNIVHYLGTFKLVGPQGFLTERRLQDERAPLLEHTDNT